MKLKTKKLLKTRIANAFGVLGYLSCTLQWLWVIVLYSSLIQVIANFFIENGTKQESLVSPINSSSLASGNDTNVIFAIISATVVCLFIVLSLYMIVKIPASIVKTTRNTIHKAAESATPLVSEIQNKKDTKARHKKLSYQIVFVIKIILVVAPVIICYFTRFLDKQIFSYNGGIIISLWLALISLTFFIIQYFLARLFLIDKKEIW